MTPMIKRQFVAGVCALSSAVLLGSCDLAPGKLRTLSEHNDACAGSDMIGGEIFVNGGVLNIGDDRFYREESPVTEVAVNSFWIDQTEVTNAQFLEFTEATGYVTSAEKGLNETDIAGFPREFQKPGSIIFKQPEDFSNAAPDSWWAFAPGANWRHPFGPHSNIDGKESYPVVHITYEDAIAYANWRGRRLPTEAEWEYAARAGDKVAEKNVKPLRPGAANVWQGVFPFVNSQDDGYAGIAPAGCFTANSFELYDMIGNVWELTSSVYFPSHKIAPQSDDRTERGFDPRQPGAPVRVIKGGSYLCSANYCLRFRPEARQAQDTYFGSSHVGFRTVRDG